MPQFRIFGKNQATGLPIEIQMAADTPQAILVRMEGTGVTVERMEELPSVFRQPQTVGSGAMYGTSSVGGANSLRMLGFLFRRLGGIFYPERILTRIVLVTTAFLLIIGSIVAVRPNWARPLIATVFSRLVGSHGIEAGIPDAAITPDTCLVAWVNFSSPDFKSLLWSCLELQAQASAKDKEEGKRGVAAIIDFRDKFLAAGGEGVLIGWIPPANDGEEPLPPYVLIKVESGADTGKIESLIHNLSNRLAADNAEAAAKIRSLKVAKYGDNGEWCALIGATNDKGTLSAAPTSGTAKDAGVFNAALKPGGSDLFQFCFRMSPKMKAEVKAQLDKPVDNPSQDDLLMRSLMKPMLNLNTVTVFGSATKGSRRLDIAGHFRDPKSAADFTIGANGGIQMMRGLAGLDKMAPDGLDMKNVNDVLSAIIFKKIGVDSAIKFNDDFFAKVEIMISQIQAAQEKTRAANN